MIGITGVTGKLGSKVAQLISEQGISARHLARNPQRAALYDNAELVQAAFENSLEAVEALKGIDVLLMVSASESPNRLQQHLLFLMQLMKRVLSILFTHPFIMLLLKLLLL